MTDGFGYRVHPLYGDRRLHRGIDISAPVGTPIWAVADGTVITAEWDNSYGNFVEIRHGDGTVTLYAHADKLFVAKGQQVKQGEAIAAVGSTGRSSGPHLHFEVLPDGKIPVDPMAYLTGGGSPRLVLNLD
jgi:murein DD-endopeptidase MepM/ murein hydrolase activator NlpD